jgi:hypothetical protein
MTRTSANASSSSDDVAFAATELTFGSMTGLKMLAGELIDLRLRASDDFAAGSPLAKALYHHWVIILLGWCDDRDSLSREWVGGVL